ncbi:MAG: DNA primase [Clostridia bacterium]|nr:DNA primase [Clostridia bacterium]
MAFNDAFLEELRAKNEISEVIGSYVNLKRAGRLYKGLCPFHGEKTPSFTVYPDTQSFYCFGCGAGGDVVTFIRKAENLDYIEAVKLLADRSGVRMPDSGYDDSMLKRRNRIYEINKEAAHFFFRQLTDEQNRHALQYYFNRGYTFDTIKHFGLGYAPDSWDALKKHLNELHYSNEELYAANLLKKSAKGGYYDNFRGRVMIPIIDIRGRVVGFGGRVMDDSKPKYINTSDTLAYKKTHQIFAMNFAKNHCKDAIILCEGYMDVIALHQAGFENAVASCGTALTPEQVRTIAKYTDTVILSQDADEAGRKAVDKSIALFGEVGIKVKVLNVQGAKDPDEYIQKFGADRFKALLEGAETDTEYKLLLAKQKYDLTSPAQLADYVGEAARILSELSPVKRDIYASEIAEQTKVSKQAILSESKRFAGKAARTKRREMNRSAMQMQDDKDKINPEKRRHKAAALAEEHIIAVLMNHPDCIRTVSANLTEEDFVTAFNRHIFAVITRRIREGKSLNLSAVAQELSEEELGTLAGLEAMGKSLGNPQRELLECITTLKEEKLKLVQPDLAHMSDEEFRKLFEN